MSKVLLLSVGILTGFWLSAQNAADISTSKVCKNAEAIRTGSAPLIDGVLDDEGWKNASAANDFLQNTPLPGANAHQRTEVRIIYDDEAIYIGARMFDSAPDSILHQLGPRDEYNNNADAFGVFLDTYHDRRNAFLFAVTAAGVQSDARYTFDKTDMSLNSVWYSKVKIDELGWCVEMKIPYQALRFPKSADQVWGLNFMRSIRRYREFDYWNNIDPSTQGIINQCGDLSGLKNIISPVRLAFLPYVSGYVENYQGSTSFSANGGLDVKYGINESFTLDMTLIPDFGQTISDNIVLNLSPFEVKYDERRYFFTEGTELFNKNDLLYSRRIGAKPISFASAAGNLNSNEILLKNPDVTRLYNAVKISGRTPKKIGIGFLNAISAPSFAIIQDTLSGNTRTFETQSITNYNVLVVDKILPHNSYIGFLNTSVVRAGSSRDALVSSLQFKIADKKNRYAIESYGDMSNMWNANTSAPSTGFRYNVLAGKVSGSYLANARFKYVSPDFDPNDLGFSERNNYMDIGLEQKYNFYKPFKCFVWQFNTVDASLGVLVEPRDRTFLTISGKHFFTFRNYLTCGINWLTNPILSHDYFEARVPGRYLIYPKNYNIGGFVSSDYRKKFSLDGGINYRIFLERDRTIFNYNLSPRWRANDKLFIVYKWENEIKKDNVGYVNYRNDSLFFGVRDINTVTNTLTATYIFTNTMGLSLRARHYWSEAAYKHYFLVNENGKSEEAYYNGNADVSFNAFNIDMIFTWQFLPGSELSFVWKNSLLSSDKVLHENYFDDSKSVFDSPQSNSLSMKLIWYLDAGHFFAKHTG